MCVSVLHCTCSVYKASWKNTFTLHKQRIDHLVLCLKARDVDPGVTEAQQVNGSLNDVTGFRGRVVQGVVGKGDGCCVRNGQGIGFKGQKDPVITRKQVATSAVGAND